MKSHLRKGKFIVFEGGEGCGKTTQINLLKSKYKDSNNIIFTREPGGTEIADQIREIITTGKSDKLLPESDLLLVYASRYEHVHKLILPAINSGKTVICDRFYLSTLVYQGVAGGLSLNYIETLHNLFLQNLEPDLTFLLDLDIKTSKSRTAKRNQKNERFEQFPDDFHQKIRQGYLRLSKTENNIHLIDATQPTRSIHNTILITIQNL